MQQKKTHKDSFFKKMSRLISIRLTGKVFKSEMQLWHRIGLVDYYFEDKILATLKLIIMCS